MDQKQRTSYSSFFAACVVRELYICATLSNRVYFNALLEVVLLVWVCMCTNMTHTFCLCLHTVFVWACPCLYVCSHPGTASSAWSAWSVYPPQPPCLLLSSWKQARLYAEICISSSRACTARTHIHTQSPSFLFSSSSLSFSPPPFSMVAPARNPISIIHPLMLSHSISQRSTSPSRWLPFFSPTRSYSICPTLLFPCFLLGVVASHPPSLAR